MIRRLLQTRTPEIKLVAIDLDGTLLTDDKRVTEPTVHALRALKRKKVHVVIASARPPRSVRPTYQVLRLDTLQVNYNGALIWDEIKREIFHHQPMPAREIRRMVQFARSISDSVLVSCEVLDKWYTDRDDHTHTTATGKLFKPDLIAPLEEWCTLPVTKLMLLGPPRLMKKITPLLQQECGEHFAMIHTDPDLIQIMNRRAGKSVAVAKVARHYGIKMENVLAIGDAPNDVAMIAQAGIGVAMGNAHKLAKKAADWVAPSNNDHGVLATLRKFGLCD